MTPPALPVGGSTLPPSPSTPADSTTNPSTPSSVHLNFNFYETLAANIIKEHYIAEIEKMKSEVAAKEKEIKRLKEEEVLEKRVDARIQLACEETIASQTRALAEGYAELALEHRNQVDALQSENQRLADLLSESEILLINEREGRLAAEKKVVEVCEAWGNLPTVSEVVMAAAGQVDTRTSTAQIKNDYRTRINIVNDAITIVNDQIAKWRIPSMEVAETQYNGHIAFIMHLIQQDRTTGAPDLTSATELWTRCELDWHEAPQEYGLRALHHNKKFLKDWLRSLHSLVEEEE